MLSEVAERAKRARVRECSRDEIVRESFEISDSSKEVFGVAFIREVTGCSLVEARAWRAAAKRQGAP